MSVLALTMGDPAGIGPEITVSAWRLLRENGPAFAFFGDPEAFPADLPVARITDPREAASAFPRALPVIPVPLACPARPGKPDWTNAPAVIESIARATRAVLDGAADAVVTNPISKIVLARAGFPYPGHTEFLAALAGCEGDAVMMLVSPTLRVVPVSIHVSLRDAIETLDVDAILRVARTADAALRHRFGIDAPRLAIAGLNPHAGEDGRMGAEESRIIAPAIEALRGGGIDARGPYPPDTMFTPDRARRLRRRDLHVSRPGADPAQDARHGVRRERDARPADRAHLARSRHRLRHRGTGRRRSVEPARGTPPRGDAFARGLEHFPIQLDRE